MSSFQIIIYKVSHIYYLLYINLFVQIKTCKISNFLVYSKVVIYYQILIQRTNYGKSNQTLFYQNIWLSNECS